MMTEGHVESSLLQNRFGGKIRGCLLGTALGDALGFIAEGLDFQSIERRYGTVRRFYVMGDRGFVTDDTEQSALVAQCLVKSPSDSVGFVRSFRKAMLLWYLCLPFGIGRATSKACLRIAFGAELSGVESSGNGAAMRAAILGAYFFDNPEARYAYGRELARVSHKGTEAVEGALFVAEMAAQLMVCDETSDLFACFSKALDVVSEGALKDTLRSACELAERSESREVAVDLLNRKPYAYVVNSLGFSTFCLLRYGRGDVLECLAQTVGGGGDTDTNAAIVGGWLGSLRGESRLPLRLIERIDDGPFGPTHLRKLADALARVKYGERMSRAPSYSLIHSALRNIALVPVLLGHAACRLVPLSSESDDSQY